MFIICLVYLFYFCSILFAATENSYEFEPYKKSSNTKIDIDKETNKAGKKYLSSPDKLQSLKVSSEALTEVEELLSNIENSTKELAEAEPRGDDEKEAILKAFAELDGVLSYVYTQLKSGKEQLTSIRPITREEIAAYNSLKLKFMSYMKRCRDLKMFIAEKLANASKGK